MLRQLGRQSSETDLQGLIEAGYLEPGSADTLLCIASHHLERLCASSYTPTELPVKTAPSQPTVPAAPSLVASDLLIAEVKKLSQIVDQARKYREQLPALQREVAELEGVIARATERLAVVKPQLDGVVAKLQDPALVIAEDTLSTIRQLSGTS